MIAIKVAMEHQGKQLLETEGKIEFYLIWCHIGKVTLGIDFLQHGALHLLFVFHRNDVEIDQ